MKLALTFPGCHKRAGVEKIMLETANFLADRGHDVSVYAAEFETSSLSPAVRKVQVILPPSRFAPALGLFDSAVSKQLANDRPDLQCSFGTVCPTGGVLWVQSVHKAWLEISQSTRNLPGRLQQFCNPSHPLLLQRERMHFSARRYKRLLALTPDVAADLQRLYGVPADDIDLLPNGFSTDDFNPGIVSKLRSVSRSELGYGPSDKVIVFVANELERKGFGPLIEAVSRLHDDTVKILVAGNVKDSAYRSRLAELGLYSRTKFVGPSDKVAKYYAAADVFALPTKYEAWGMVIVEALACGLPVVTSRSAGAAIAVEEGVTGFLLTDPTDHLELEQKLRHALYDFKPDPFDLARSVNSYSWSTVLKRYEEILAAQVSTNLRRIEFVPLKTPAP